MKYRITESRLRSIINNAVRIALREGEEDEYKPINGERFDELLRQNNLTAQDLYGMLPGVSEERMLEAFYDDDEPDEDTMYQDWLFSLYDNHDFEDLLTGLKGLDESERNALENGEYYISDSKILQQEFKEIYDEAYKSAKDIYEDERGFDPWYDYVHPWDFYSK